MHVHPSSFGPTLFTISPFKLKVSQHKGYFEAIPPKMRCGWRLHPKSRINNEVVHVSVVLQCKGLTF